MKLIKVLFLLAVVGYLVSVFAFEYDPLKLIIKKTTAAQGQERGRSPQTAIMENARSFIQPGRSALDIETRFGTVGNRMEQVYKRAFLIGEAKYDQYSFYLGHGVTAYVLFETFASKVADHPERVSFNKPH